MSDAAIGGWGIAALLLAILLRMPIGLAMLLCGLMGSAAIRGRIGPVLAQMKTLPYDTFASSSLAIVPLFLLMGQFATRGGLSRALFDAAAAWVGHLRGGMAMAAIGACAGFGAVCGSSTATAATMSQVALPELRRHGYAGSLATGTLAAGGTLGILIPPSVVLIVYAMLAEQNVAALFLAAFVPGILAALGYALTVSLVLRARPGLARPVPRASWAERRRASAAAWPVLAIFLIVFGGIYGGIFTPAEAAAIGAAATGIAALARRGLGRRGLVQALLETASGTGTVLFIVLGAVVFNAFLALSGLPQAAAAAILAAQLSPLAVLTVMLLLYLLLGTVMDSMAMILLTVPIFFPIVMALDFGLTPDETALWFGVLALATAEVGLISPPVGLNLFIVNRLAGDVPMRETWRGVMPFLLSDLLRIAVLVAAPVLTLGLVRWLG